ncbi:Upstream activation factor subunit spp27 like [Quillaja saponaria]|uniref:Upstream activation factor subunit spp27 like n=1 Tax=Quillaja saponaria TaxID=32244 RepID=A0AAD7P8T2_QUISA|nr:Upstream activation factor subunit spp27 like [Quillaja saponaria]
MVSDQEIAKGVENVLRQSDPNSVTSLNAVVQQLEAQLGINLSHKAGFIRDQINFLLQTHPTTPPSRDQFTLQHHQQYPTTHAQQFATHFALHPHHRFDELNFGQPQEPPAAVPTQQPLQLQSHVQPQLPTTEGEVSTQNIVTVASKASKESAPAGGKRRGGPGGLNKVCGVTPELQAVVGEPAMPRTEIVKQLWAYIRKNNLQDPSNKRKIICDDALRLVFETDCTDMFKMNKLLAKHIITLGPTKESGQAKRIKVDVEASTESKEPGSSPVVISEALAKFLSTEEREMLQSEAVRLVWEYIKVNHLEDPLNPMVIICDAKLQELLGCDSISALGIPEMLARHHLFKQS